MIHAIGDSAYDALVVAAHTQDICLVAREARLTGCHVVLAKFHVEVRLVEDTDHLLVTGLCYESRNGGEIVNRQEFIQVLPRRRSHLSNFSAQAERLYTAHREVDILERDDAQAALLAVGVRINCQFQPAPHADQKV